MPFPSSGDLENYSKIDNDIVASQNSKLDSVLPAVVLAARELTNWNWEIIVGDTECSSTQVC